MVSLTVDSRRLLVGHAVFTRRLPIQFCHDIRLATTVNMCWGGKDIFRQECVRVVKLNRARGGRREASIVSI